MREGLATRRCTLCQREHVVRVDKIEASFNCFTGLMGETEMECALAVMVNKARERGGKVAGIRFKREDFSPEGYDRDGFDSLLANGWLRESCFKMEYWARGDLLRRLHSRIPFA